MSFADFVKINPQATYLRTNKDTSASSAVPVALASLAFPVTDSSYVRLTRLGAWQNFAGSVEKTGLTAIFSNSSILLAANNQIRVTGAIEAGNDFNTLLTHYDQLPTDIPQDFLLSSADGSFAGVIVKVPAGANYLFFSVVDSFYGDNLDTDANFGVSIEASVQPPAISCHVSTMAAQLTFENLLTAREYRVMQSNGLADWAEIYRFTANSAEMVWLTPLSPGDRMFYRLEWNE